MTDDVRAKREALIRAYFDAWLDRDPSRLADFFSPEAVYVESYGPEYRGLGQIARWFRDWLPHGAVLRWDIHGFLHDGAQCAVEWYFRCRYDENESGFDGVTLIDFDKSGRILRLREFSSEPEHRFPYGETPNPTA